MPDTEHLALTVPVGDIELSADLAMPTRAVGIALFAHGSGSSRHSPRNRLVARVLNQGKIATVLIDLLTEDEEAEDRHTAALRFDIPLLAGRLLGITDWMERHSRLGELGLGYFGASTGAAAALVAAAERPRVARAVVSRGGRPDLAGEALRRVRAPSLFIVGGDDQVVLDMNRTAMAALPAGTAHKLEIIPGATHLFEEPGTLDQVAILARNWFQTHLAKKVHTPSI